MNEILRSENPSDDEELALCVEAARLWEEYGDSQTPRKEND